MVIVYSVLGGFAGGLLGMWVVGRYRSWRMRREFKREALAWKRPPNRKYTEDQLDTIKLLRGF